MELSSKGAINLKYSAIEFQVIRRHLKISFQEAAELIGRCSEEEWSAYELGVTPPPQDVTNRLKDVHNEFLRLFKAMENQPPITLPALLKLTDFKALFGPDCTRLAWRVYTAVVHQLFCTHNFNLSTELSNLPPDSPLMSVNLHL